MSENLHFIALAETNAPVIDKDSKTEYVPYGESNDYFKYLIDRYLGSTTNQAVIDGKAKLIFGKGLEPAGTRISKFAQIKEIISDDELMKIIKDRVLFEMAAIVVTKEGKKVKMTHWPMESLRAVKVDPNDQSAQIKEWWSHPTWEGSIKKEQCKVFPVYDPKATQKESILIIRGYTPGNFYYEPPCYQGAISYALLEEEIGDFLVTDVQTSFSGTKMVNFNNGIPTERKQDEIVEKLRKSLTGAKGMKMAVSFNDGSENATTIEDIPLNDAPAHYQYLAEECERKLLKAHKSPSVLLGFNADNQGFSNNAEELQNKMIAFDNYVIKPYQWQIIQHLNVVLNANDIAVKLYFKTLEPLEFGAPVVEEEELQLAKQANEALREFIAMGEELPEGWSVVDDDFVGDDDDAFHARIQELNAEMQKLELSAQPKKKWYDFISTGTAKTNVKSEDDAQIGDNYYRVRYRYTGSINPQRPFCVAMMAANKLYRKEDILAMESRAVNPGWGPGGANTYSIWKYKGGGNCYHKWQRVTFKNDSRFKSIDPDDQISNAQAEREGFRIRNESEVSAIPRFMPNQGFLS